MAPLLGLLMFRILMKVILKANDTLVTGIKWGISIIIRTGTRQAPDETVIYAVIASLALKVQHFHYGDILSASFHLHSFITLSMSYYRQ